MRWDLRKSGLSPIFPLKSAILIICQESEEIRLLSFDDLYHCHSKSGFSPADDLYHYHLGAISLQCGRYTKLKNINSPLSLAIVTGRIRKYTRNTNNLSYFREISISTVHTCPEVTQQIEILKQYSPEETQQMHRADILANLRKHRKMDESGMECN